MHVEKDIPREAADKGLRKELGVSKEVVVLQRLEELVQHEGGRGGRSSSDSSFLWC